MFEFLLNPLFLLFFVILILVVLFFLAGIVIIRDNQVGICIRKIFGNPMPQGQIIARNSGDVGIQSDVLMPKLYWRNPITWKIKKARMIEIGPGKVGVVEAIDGEALPHGRLLGDAVDCNSYQDAKVFLDNNGKRGPQVAILTPGFYRINNELFRITTVDATKIKEETIGVVVAQDGTALPSGFIIAPKPTEDIKTHKFYQDGQTFIENQGFRGPQLDTLQPGEYYINPLLFDVQDHNITEVLPGYVAVLRSNIGQELAKDTTIPKEVSKKPNFEQPIHELEEVVLTTDKNQRGIWSEPVAPGNYNLNPLAFDAYMVPTSAVTIDWASGTEIRAEHRIDGKLTEDVSDEKAKEFFKFSQLRVTSKDGFQLEVDVRMIIRIRPQHASFVIARFGSVANLIEQIVHPLIDSSFRNKAGEKKAIDFFADRTNLQKEALEKAQAEFEKYHVEAQNLLIAYIKIPESLLETQTFKEIAMQQQNQYEEQAKAQEKFITVKEKEARALKQKDVIDAKLSKDIELDRADALRNQAAGIRDKTKSIADGDAYQNIQVGTAIAEAYGAQAEVIGPQILGALKAFEKISDGNIKITPDVLVTSGSQDGGGNLINTLLAMMIKEGAIGLPKPIKQHVTQTKHVLPTTPIETAEIKLSTNPSIQNTNITLETQTSEERLKQLNDEIEKDARKRMGEETDSDKEEDDKSTSTRTRATRQTNIRVRGVRL